MIRGFVPPRRATSRKGENGSVLVIGGSYLYHGAPILSSMAALRCGTDLVYTCVPKINVTSTRALLPDLIVIPLADQKLTRGAANKLVGMLPHLDSATLGMGLAIQERTALLRLVESLLNRDIRVSLDASALVPEILPVIKDKNVIVTPHAGEFKRLFGSDIPDSKDERINLVERCAARYGIVVLFKSATDIISDGSTTYLNVKETPAMTVGGTGDVLSGLVAGMLSKNRDTLESAATAAFVNTMAGSAAQDRLGLHITSSDLLTEIPNVMKPLDRIVRE